MLRQCVSPVACIVCSFVCRFFFASRIQSGLGRHGKGRSVSYPTPDDPKVCET